ncbi:MAG: HAD hydrolase-like protein [Gemmatimonadetes bacterium]|nr:HAD hydrolase-like protein [Gemmatimonadota bacterium]
MKLLIFDIDATLLLSGGAGARALDRAFEEVTGTPDGMEGIRFHGMTDYAIIRQMGQLHRGEELSREQMDSIRSLYAKYLVPELEHGPGFRVLDGVVALLDRLTDNHHYHLGLATGNFAETGKMKLRRGELDHYFHYGGFGSDSEIRPELTKVAVEKGREHAGAPDLARDSVYVIGDTIYDIRSGNEAGARTIGVATGSTPAADLAKEGAYAVMNDLTSIEEFLTIIES